MKEIPVFLFNGFLDSGKTTLIKEIVSQTNVYKNYNTLIIATEDGEEQYDEDWCKENQVNVVVAADDDYKDEIFFYELYKKYKPIQIVIETNAFLDFEEFRLPRNFIVYQEITLFDAGKFELYYNNMKPLINQMVSYATLVVFNRCNDNKNLSKYRRNIRAFNQKCDVAFENSEGKMTTILDEDLPYDINSKSFVVADKDFPIFYLDISEAFEKYQGKIITFNTYVRGIEKETLIVGRKIMTCCEDDIQFYGFECITDLEFELNSYVELTCIPVKHYSDIAKKEVIMLKAVNIKELDYEEEQYLEF